MKFKLNPSLKTSANALLVTVIFMMVLALSVGGYMTYVMQQARLGARSQAWNTAMAVSEAGIEEGLEHLNSDTNNLANNGWTQYAPNLYTITRSLGGTFQASYTVKIDFSNPLNPTLTSTASVTPPAAAYNHTKSPFFYATATTTTTSIANVSRGVYVVAFKPTYFTAAMVAKGSIILNGNNVTVNSFNSADPSESTDGQYDPKKAGSDGTVASDGGISNSISSGNANIFGPVYTGAGEPLLIGPNGVVGTYAWYNAGNSGIEPGYSFDTANFTFPNTELPYSSGLTPLPGTVTMLTGTNINSTTNYNVPYLPGGLTNGETVGPITTNQTSVTVSTYPGAISGITSNFTWVTVSSYPGPEIGGVVTNTISYNKTTIPPTPGDYIGSVTTNNTGTKYTYTAITGYTYQSWLWTYPTNNYTYALYDSSVSYATNTYDDVLSSGSYYSAVGLGNTIVTGPVTLVLPNGYNIGNLTIAPGGSLTLFVGGNNWSISGNSVVNANGLAQNLIVYCAPSVTSFSLTGNGQFEGVIVAPYANVTLGGGGANTMDYMGAIMANSITLNGHINFHYDTELSKVPSWGRYLIQSWRELKLSQQ